MSKNTKVSNPSLRIVSLVPSLTELVIELGLQDCVVGRTGFCIHPREAVEAIPKVGGTKDVQLAKVRALSPTHVLVNVDENRHDTVQALREWVPHVIVTHPCTPQDNLALIDQLMQALAPWLLTNRPAPNATLSAANNPYFMRAESLKQQFSERLQRLQTCQNHRPEQRVLYLIWRDPWMSVARDTYISRMLALIGWQTWPDIQGGDGLSSPGRARYPVIQGDESWLRDVDRVLLSSEPYRFGAEHIQPVQAWMQTRGSHATVECVDGELLSWYGWRAVAGLAYLEALGQSAREPGAEPATLASPE
jgi:hypothetical protein